MILLKHIVPGEMCKTTHNKGLVLLACFLLPVIMGCGDSDTVSLRRFPYPYQAALAICSDIDETESVEELIAIQMFLNSEMETGLGPGLSLDIGNSFWFYNDYIEFLSRGSTGDSDTAESYSGNTDFGISLFNGTSDSLSDCAPVLLALIRAGFVDCLHAYGHFGQGDFSRSLAKQAVELLADESIEVDVYINHGGQANRQNIGDASWFQGDNPGTQYYHTDLTIPAGIRFLWRGQLTHCIGQDGDFSVRNLLKRTYEYIQDLWYSEQDYPHDNKLVHLYELDDGAKVFEFVRYINPWGKYSTATEEFLASQLGPDQVDELIDNHGYMIFYTHLGKNQGPPYMSRATVDALRYIKRKYDHDSLLVATTSKLLNYYVHREYLFWQWERRSDTVFVMIDSIANEVEGVFIPDTFDLQGLTFYLPESHAVSLTVAGQSVRFTRNGRDETGRVSISIPWHRPSPPDDIYELYPDLASERAE